MVWRISIWQEQRVKVGVSPFQWGCPGGYTGGTPMNQVPQKMLLTVPLAEVNYRGLPDHKEIALSHR